MASQKKKEIIKNKMLMRLSQNLTQIKEGEAKKFKEAFRKMRHQLQSSRDRGLEVEDRNLNLGQKAVVVIEKNQNQEDPKTLGMIVKKDGGRSEIGKHRKQNKGRFIEDRGA